MLVQKDDETFARAQQRLVRTAAEVSRTPAAPEQQALFLQAESVYRYRVESLPHTWSRYAAEAAWALTDFTPLQSLANAPDIADVRNHATDASTQLWEAFVERHPDSPLEPLAWYRLGWSYRSARNTGLPHSSSEAFDKVGSSAPGSRLAALAGEAKETPWKSRRAALPRSLIPGLAHFYLGEYRSGFVRLGVALAAAYVLGSSAYDASAQNSWKSGEITQGLLGFTVLSYDYADSYEDAMTGVVRYNEKVERDFEDSHPDAP